MKKITIGLFVCLLALASSARAQYENNQPERPDQGNWILQLNADTSFPTGNLNNQVDQGWGGEGSIGYRFPSNLILSIESGYDTYYFQTPYNYGNNGAWNVLPLVFKVQYGFTNDLVHPYVFAAAGFAFNSKYIYYGPYSFTANETDFLGEAGVGLSISIIDNCNFFIQGKVELDNTSSSYASDQPTYLFPISVGLQENFY